MDLSQKTMSALDTLKKVYEDEIMPSVLDSGDTEERIEEINDIIGYVKYLEEEKNKNDEERMNKMTLEKLKKDFMEELNERKDEILEEEYPEDIMREIVDGYIPIYNSDLLELADSDLWLGVEEPDLEAKNAFDCIKFNTYEELLNEGNKWLERQKED